MGPVDENNPSRIKNQNIKLIQINTQHKKATTGLISKHYQDTTKTTGKTDTRCIYSITEPYYWKKPAAPHPHLLPVYQEPTSPQKRVRALLYLPRDVPFWYMNQFSTTDEVTIGLKIHGKKVLMSSVYMPYDPQTHPITTNLHRVVQFCKKENWGLVVCADSNSHHVEWGSTNTNRRGEWLLEYLQLQNLNLENIGSIPTFSSAGRKEVIDLTITNQLFSNHVKGWRVDSSNPFESDHNPILFGFCKSRAKEDVVMIGFKVV